MPLSYFSVHFLQFAKAAAKAAEAEARAAEHARKAAAQSAAKAEKADRLANNRAAKLEAQAQKEKDKAEKEKLEKDSKEKEKKKPVRYPMEDLDVRFYERERKNGVVKGRKPIPARAGKGRETSEGGASLSGGSWADKVPFGDVDVSSEEGWSVSEWWKPKRGTSAVEGFLMTWNFLNCFGYVIKFPRLVYLFNILHLIIFLPSNRHPLHLSSFTLDEYEHALRHSLLDFPCQLLAEIHSVLIYNIRTVPSPPGGSGGGNGNGARVSVAANALRQHYKDEEGTPTAGKSTTPVASGENGASNGIVTKSESGRPTVEELCFAIEDVGNNWLRVPLRHAEGRAGWEEALVGCLKDVSGLSVFLLMVCWTLDFSF